jgi:hypothetical protein
METMAGIAKEGEPQMTATAKMDIRFFQENHTYTLNGTEVPGVTEIMEAEGLSGCAFWKEEHRNRGTAVHRIALLINSRPWRGSTVEEIVANSRWDPSKTHPKIVGYGYAMASYLLDSGFRAELVEQPVGSTRHGICGTLDIWGTLPSGERVLPDIKSGQPQEAAHVQTALYDLCLEETLGLKTDKRFALWLKPDRSYKVALPKLAPGVYTNAGICAVNLFKWRQQFRMLG